jgi:amino acid transporter
LDVHLLGLSRFRKAQKVQGLEAQNPWYRSPFQPYMAWMALVFFSTLTVFNAFKVFFEGNWNVRNFIVTYIGIP